MRLSKSEERLMDIIWEEGEVFFKDLLEKAPEPKPASTTLATMLKRMHTKGFIAFKLFGNSRQYYALVEKEDYFSKHVNSIVKSYFGDSALQFASFFAAKSNMSASELEDLKKIIDKEIKKKEK